MWMPHREDIIKYGVVSFLGSCWLFQMGKTIPIGRERERAHACERDMSIRSSLILEDGTVMEASSSGSLFQAGMWGLSLQFQLFLNIMTGMAAF
jgi:hypothetical protein